MQAAIPSVKTNHDTGLTGVIAVVCMIVDHLGAAFYPQHTWMRVIGRIAFPLFAWGIAVGAEHTRNMGRYLLRLFIMMLVSQPFYMYALNHSLLQFNIFMTLFMGLMGIWGLKQRQEWITVIMLLLAHLLSPDYAVRGVLCILLLWACRENPVALAICFSAYCVIWGQNGSVVWSTQFFSVRLQTTAILALPLMLWPKGTRTRTPRWLMYAAYPGHLAVIWLIKVLMRG